jgi:hypothetical protein
MAPVSSIRRTSLALWRRLGPTNVWRTLTLCSGFAALVAAGFIFVREPNAAGSLTDHKAGTGVQSVAAAYNAGELGVESGDPLDRFSETRVGQVIFTSISSDSCRRVLFDNRTGEFHEAAEVYCGLPIEASPAPSSVDRIGTLQKAFRR